MKGYIDKSNVVLTNRRFKGFEYSGEEKEIYSEGEEIKLNALDFFRTIEFFKKMNKNTILETNNTKLNISDKGKENKININLSLIYHIRHLKGTFSSEYLYYFLKEFKIKELKDEFIYLTFKDNSPLYIKFKEDWGFLAPMIDN